MIQLEGVSVSYPDAAPLRAVSISLGSEPTVVTGPSGSGKSTLLRVIAGLQRPDSGTVRVNGRGVAPPSWRSAGDPRVALIHQDYRLVEFLTLEENLRLAAELRGFEVSAAVIGEALERVGLGSMPTKRMPATMSGGEQQRVAIARAVVCNVQVLLADEPTGALDIDNTRLVADLMAEIGKSSAIDIVVATHDPVVVATFDHVLRLENGILCDV